MIETQEILSKFYSEVLGIKPEWEATEVWKDDTSKDVYIRVEYVREGYKCPECGKAAKPHDHRLMRLRHLDTCDYRTILEVYVLRVDCPEHKAKQPDVGFAEKYSRYTGLFETRVIEWLRTMSIKAAAEKLDVGRDAIDNTMKRGVKRGLERRKKTKARDICIDETSYQKGQKHMTSIVDKGSGKGYAWLKPALPGDERSRGRSPAPPSKTSYSVAPR